MSHDNKHSKALQTTQYSKVKKATTASIRCGSVVSTYNVLSLITYVSRNQRKVQVNLTRANHPKNK